MRFSEIISEAGSPAQQAAIAIAMKKAGKKPKGVAEGSPNADVKKQISKFEELALAANRAGDDAKCKQYQQKIQSLKQKMSQGVAEGLQSHDFMAGHCHVMALALKQLHPDWQIRAHIGYDDDEADDTEYRVDHVYTVAPDGTAYDCRGKFSNEEQLVGPDTTGGVDTQYVDFGPEEIKQAMLRGELKRFSKQDLDNAMQVGKQGVAEGTSNDYFKRRKDEEERIAGTKAPAKRTPKQTDYEKKRKEQGVAEGESNDTAISLSKLGKFHPGTDTLAEFVPERASVQYALHPDKWESTFYSLTNKDSDKLKYYGPKKISIPPGTLVGDMAIANKFYRAKTPEEQEQYAELYKASLQPYPVDVSQYRMPELLIPKQGVAENKAAGINKMFNNLGDPVFSNLQRVALLAMQGRQQEASGRLQSVIKDASPAVQKKIIDAVNSIKPVTINGKIADSSTIDKSKQHQDWIINTFIPWVQSLLGQQGVAEGSETPHQQQVRAAITKGMEKWDSNNKSTYQSQPTKTNYMPPSGYASDSLTGVDSIDPDGTVVISLGNTGAEATIKKLATLGGMSGIKTRQLQSPTVSSRGVEEGENWSKHNNPRAGGMSKKSVSSYRRSHPGSKIQTAVTTKPSKLKKGSKSAKRRASFCARMRGMKKHRTGAKTARDPNSNINKSLRRWHCESIEELHELVMLAEQYIRNNKK